MTRKISFAQAGIEPGSSALVGDALTTGPARRLVVVWWQWWL